MLRFSFVGILSLEITVGESATINAGLGPDVNSLDEVVIIGYGTQKRGNVTGAVTAIDSEMLASRPITDVARGL